jgi:hypothetical protein
MEQAAPTLKHQKSLGRVLQSKWRRRSLSEGSVIKQMEKSGLLTSPHS